MYNLSFFKMEELNGFIQDFAKVHSMKYRGYVQYTDIIIQKMCVNVMYSDYMFNNVS